MDAVNSSEHSFNTIGGMTWSMGCGYEQVLQKLGDTFSGDCYSGTIISITIFKVLNTLCIIFSEDWTAHTG